MDHTLQSPNGGIKLVGLIIAGGAHVYNVNVLIFPLRRPAGRLSQSGKCEGGEE